MYKYVMTFTISTFVFFGIYAEDKQEDVVISEVPADLEIIEQPEIEPSFDQLYAYTVENPFEDEDESDDSDYDEDDEDLGRSPYSNSMFV